MDTEAKRGRPVLYTDTIADYICSKIAEGIPLAEICREETMPGRTTVYEWIKDNPQFCEQIERAREVGFDAIAEETMDIADDGTNDYMKRTGKDGEESWVLNGEHAQRSKLRIETRLKLLAKWHPKKYGDKLDLTSLGDKILPMPAIAIYNTAPPLPSSEDKIDS